MTTPEGGSERWVLRISAHMSIDIRANFLSEISVVEIAVFKYPIRPFSDLDCLDRNTQRPHTDDRRYAVPKILTPDQIDAFHNDLGEEHTARYRVS